MEPLEPGLYVVATPIGNLGDITLRALDTLRAADLVLCEDTRTTVKLFNRHAITTPMESFHKFNETSRAAGIISRIRNGAAVALVSDAGTPLISDPGSALIEGLISEGLPFYVIPGPTALVPALIMSGLTSPNGFVFRGFLPKRESDKRRVLAETAFVSLPVIFYVAPQDVGQTLAIAEELFPQRRLSLSRELTKLHEETVRGKARELTARPKTIKGEFVLVLEAASPEPKPPLPEAEVLDIQFRELIESSGRSEALRVLASRYGVTRREIYAALLRAKKEGGEDSPPS